MPINAPDIEKEARKPREENQFRFVISVFMRRWVLIAVFAAVASIAFGLWGIWTHETKETWTASAKLRVVQSPYDQALLKDLLMPNTPKNTAKVAIERIDIQEIARDVVRAMVQEDLAAGQEWANLTDEQYEDTASRIAGSLLIEPEEGGDDTRAIAVTATGPVEAEVRRTAELAARAFIQRNRQKLDEGEEQIRGFVQEQLNKLEDKLEKKESEEWQFRKEMGFRTHDQVIEKMTKWREELAEAETSREELRARLSKTEAELKSKNEQLPGALGQVTDSVVNELLGELDELLREQLVTSIQWTDEYPPLQELKEDIEEKKQAVLAAVRKLDEGMEGGTTLWTQRQDLRRKYFQIQLDMVALDVRTATIDSLLAKRVEELPDLTEKGLAHKKLEREVDAARENLDRWVTKELEMAAVMQQRSGEVVRGGDVGASSIITGDISLWINFVIGGIVGFVFGFGLCMMLELMDTSIRSIEDVTEYIGLEVIGAIPKMRFGRGKGGRRRGNFVDITDDEQIHACIVTQHDPKSPISEAYRTLRTNFQFATIQQRPKTMMITSAVPGEGKTTTAVNMAVTLADTGVRVLLVDTDLRRPHVHHVLRMERGVGIADVLREDLDCHSVIRQTRVENLWMVSSGRVPPNPSELIGSDKMRHLMAELGNEFDLVICDAPSVLVVTDPVLLARDVDTVALVVSANNARRETVVRANKLLETANAHVAGVVLNGLEATRRHYYYYYYYYDDAPTHRQRKWYHL
jgi:capsular exopolysaccharide synthesis family protein